MLLEKTFDLCVVNNLPVEQNAHSNTWMMALIFNEWLIKQDNILDQKIVLLVDICTARSVSVLLKNIKVYLPADTEMLIQPCDQEIIRTQKACYCRETHSRNVLDMKKIKL